MVILQGSDIKKLQEELATVVKSRDSPPLSIYTISVCGPGNRFPDGLGEYYYNYCSVPGMICSFSVVEALVCRCWGFSWVCLPFYICSFNL